MNYTRIQFELELVAGGLFLITGTALALIWPSAGVATVEFDHLCCSCLAQPIVTRIRSIEAVERADVNIKTNRIDVRFTAKSAISPERLWNAANGSVPKPKSIFINGYPVQSSSHPVR